MIRATVTLLWLLAAAPAAAGTIVLGPHRYEVTADVVFAVDNASSDSFLFSWSDGTGIYANVADPTFVLHAGRTYVFRRVSAKHPLALADATLPVAGADGSYARTTADPGALEAAILQPRDAFTADPAPTTDAITWTPATAGTFWYTCDIPAHVAMTGRVEITAGEVAVAPRTWSALKAVYR